MVPLEAKPPAFQALEHGARNSRPRQVMCMIDGEGQGRLINTSPRDAFLEPVKLLAGVQEINRS